MSQKLSDEEVANVSAALAHSARAAQSETPWPFPADKLRPLTFTPMNGVLHKLSRILQIELFFYMGAMRPPPS
jgi:hypothetical protein